MKGPRWKATRDRARTLRAEGWKRLRGGPLSPGRAAISVAVGAFVGSLPLYGLHLPLCLSICVPLRLDSAVAYLAANISNPLVAPFLVFLEVQVGSLILSGHSIEFSVEAARQSGVAGVFAFALTGAFFVGTALAIIGGSAAWTLGTWIRRQRRQRETV